MKKQPIYFSLIFFSLFLVLLIFFKPLNIEAQSINEEQGAQIIQISHEASPSAKPTPQAPDWQAEISAVEKTMRGQLEEYRTAYRAFLVARDQYSKLETLQSINELVIAWKKVMDKRIMVMQSYFSLLKLHLHKTAGFDSLRKDTLLKEIDLDLAIMQSHQSNLHSTENRALIEALALEYPILNESWQNTAYTTLAWINFIKLEQVFLEAKNLQQYTDEQFLQASSSGQKKEKKRAMDEIKNVLVLVENQLIKIKLNLKELSTESEIYKNSYSKLTRDLSPVYANLNKLLGYYSELAQLYFSEKS